MKNRKFIAMLASIFLLMIASAFVIASLIVSGKLTTISQVVFLSTAIIAVFLLVGVVIIYLAERFL